MNVCDYYVKEVLKTPRQVRYNAEGTLYEWWEVDISYYYDDGSLREKSLDFNTYEEALKVVKGYHFLA